MRLSLSTYVKDKYQFSYFSQFHRIIFRNPRISSVSSKNYWTYDYSADGNYTLPGKLEIGSDVDFDLRQKLNAYDVNNNVIVMERLS